jgi:hypothetical protein
VEADAQTCSSGRPITLRSAVRTPLRAVSRETLALLLLAMAQATSQCPRPHPRPVGRKLQESDDSVGIRRLFCETATRISCRKSMTKMKSETKEGADGSFKIQDPAHRIMLAAGGCQVSEQQSREPARTILSLHAFLAADARHYCP